ncbi:hypothetical protein D9M71_276790 [compost metagenome]
MRQRQQQPEAQRQRRDARQQEAAGEAVAAMAEDDRTEDAGAAEQQQQHGGHFPADAGHPQGERLDVAVGGELRADHHHGQGIDADQRRAPEQQRQAAQRPGILARQQRQRAGQPEHRQAGDSGDAEEGRAPAQRLANHPAERNAEHHRQGRPGRQQAQRLRLLPRRRDAHGQRRGDRPEHRMGEGDAEPADHQHAEAPCHARQQVAADEQQEDEHQQPPPLDIARQQHHRQRGQRYHPGIDGQHQADLGYRQVETAADIAEQPDRHELGGVEDEGGQRQRDHAEPASFLGGGGGCHFGVGLRGCAAGDGRSGMKKDVVQRLGPENTKPPKTLSFRGLCWNSGAGEGNRAPIIACRSGAMCVVTGPLSEAVSRFVPIGVYAFDTFSTD